MPFICREAINSEVRKPHEGAYKAQLRLVLANPGLSAEQREYVKNQISEVGKPKSYRADAPPKPGAISFQEPLPPRKILASLKRADLLILAQRLGISTDGTKVQIIDRLLQANHKGG